MTENNGGEREWAWSTLALFKPCPALHVIQAQKYPFSCLSVSDPVVPDTCLCTQKTKLYFKNYIILTCAFNLMSIVNRFTLFL